MEETTTESSDDEVVAPSQVTAREGAGGLRSLEVGAPGQALTHSQGSLASLPSPPSSSVLQREGMNY